MKKLMSGNEAVARGAYEAGCMIATGYPGTPSTEILENITSYKEIYAQWSVNEKVAMEVAAGAAAGGTRVLCTMKVVGLNVAMDPLMTLSYLGVNGGTVVIVADDPGCSSSQTEQDNRLVAPFAKIPLIEPSDSQECKDYLKFAFKLSEQFDTPVLFRMTTRVCHSKSIVELGERIQPEIKEYVNTKKYCSSPTLARQNHAKLEQMLVKLEEYANECEINRIEWGDKSIGIITSGPSYLHAKEVFGENASYLKLGLTHALPKKVIKDFCSSVKKVYVIEENEPFLENAIKLMGIDCVGKDSLPILYELTPEVIRNELTEKKNETAYEIDINAPSRPPILCSGCPHRSIFYAVSKYKDIVTANDIGCYTLGMVPPLGVTDTIICMGAGISAGIGLEKSFKMSGQKKKVFGFIGDSTFFHSGITGLIDAVWNQSNMAVCILDNSTTAMTGHQQTPGNGKTLSGEPSPIVDIETVVKASGIKEENIRIVDAYDFAAVEDAVKTAYNATEVFVIITKRPCALLKEVQKQRANVYCEIDQDKCKKCKACIRIGCPSVIIKDGTFSISRDSCNGCSLCQQVCKFNAIKKVGE